MRKPISTLPKEETAILVGIVTQRQTDAQLREYLAELKFLADTAGARTLRNFTQHLECPHNRTFVGTGKLEEIKAYVIDNEVDMVIFDDELSPTQLRNIEGELKCKVLDRTNLILDIFAKHAKTAHAKAQVELAQYEYILPRLMGMWTHLERQKGGIGLRGPGEKEIETDRRIIRDKIALLKEELRLIDRQMQTQRKNRGAIVRISLVGYTNVGKSTIMNMLSKSDVYADNKLFATLDTTVRKVVVENLPFLLSDTVGFIRKLPHSLVESFKSTLDELRESDILLHVIDISHHNFVDQMEVVQKTITEIGAGEKPMYMIFNKIDAYKFEQKDEDDLSPVTSKNWSLNDLRNMWMAKNKECLFISAKNRTNLDEFKDLLYKKVREIHETKFHDSTFLYPDMPTE